MSGRPLTKDTRINDNPIKKDEEKVKTTHETKLRLGVLLFLLLIGINSIN